VTTSTRLTSSCGNWLTSVTPVTLAPTTRWPSSRVSVRSVPRPRSDSEDRPWMPLDVLKVFVVRPVLPCRAGSSTRVLNRFGLAAFSRSAALRLVVGVGWVKPRAAMREPDTTTVLTPLALVAATGAGTGPAGEAAWSAGSVAPAAAGAPDWTSWARAGMASMPQALATARLISVRWNGVCIVSPFF
jgi:hypothetical protein